MKSFFFKLLLLITVLFMSGANIFAQMDYPPPWEKYISNPLNVHDFTPGSWNQSVTVPCVIFNPDSNRFEMWFTAFTGATPNPGIGYTYSSDGITWVSPILVMIPGPAPWESLFIGGVSVLKEGSLYKMWYTGYTPLQIGYATSPDGIIWTKDEAHNPVLSPGTGWESGGVAYPSVIKVPDGYWMFYTGEVSGGISRTGRAFSTDGINWQKDSINNPVLLPGGWDQNNFLARVLPMNDSLYMCYTAESVPGNNSTTAIGFAKSADLGITWVKDAGNPIIAQGTPGIWDYGRIETGSIIYTPYELRIYYDGSGSATGNLGRIGLAISSPFIPVPVELISFTATANGSEIVLNWATATEINNSGFSIERKYSNYEYSEIGFVPGFGTTTEPKSYSYTDSKVSTGKYTYRLKQIDFSGSFEYSPELEVEVSAPLVFSLGQNYPNPFNPSTLISYQLSTGSNTVLKVYDLLGNEAATLANGYKAAGRYEIEFSAAALPSGVYFYQLRAGEYTAVKKMLLIK
jgi:predicted GH43/DUF377 family glycosyl hydrolase